MTERKCSAEYPIGETSHEALFSRAVGSASPVSAEVQAIARNNLSMILGKLASVGQLRTAEALGVNESTVSRMKDSELQRFALMLAFLGIQVASIDDKLYPPAQIDALLTMVRGCLNTSKTADEFFGM